MALIISTNKANDLVKAIKTAIDEGHVDTWEYDDDGDFTHTPSQWRNEAWLRPVPYTNELRFGILKRQDVDLSVEIYAVYHGRFIEMLLAHFEQYFLTATATSKKTDPDAF